jgi:phage head maturation protease
LLKGVQMTAINFDGKIFAADTETRTLRGLIVPFGAVGNTSAGAVEFHPEAFGQIRAEEVILNMEHERTRPLGRGIVGSEKVTPAGIEMAFKIAPTTAGTDALIEAAEGLRPAFSIEASADEYEIDKGVMKVTRATLTAVAHVTNPAFKAAQITEVAASEDEQTTEAAVAEELTEETTVEENTTPAVEEVLATAAPVQAAAPAVAYTKPRSPIVSAAAFIEHKVKAHKANHESMQYVMAADEEILKASDTAMNPGLVHDSWLNEVITTSLGTTAAIDAVGVSPLVASGLSFKIPAAIEYPTVATTDEGDPASDTDMEVDAIDVTIVKKAGKQKITFELFDRSTPAFYEEVLRQLRVALGKNKDEYLLAQLIAGGTVGDDYAGTIAGLQSFIAAESSAALTGSGDFADILVASPDWWTAIKAAKDNTGRSLYNALNPMNANGVSRINSLRGEVDGAMLYVDPFLAAGSGLVDDSALLMSAEAARYWESPIRQVQVNNLSDGSIEVEYYQYVAAQVVKASGVRRFDLT